MQRKKIFLLGLIFLVMIFLSGCKTSEDGEYSILGTWAFLIEIFEGPVIEETLTFSGSETSGTITGWYYEFGPVGTYTITNTTTVEFIFDYVSSLWGHTRVVFNGTMTSRASMNGSGTWYDDDLGSTYDHNWIATKL